MVRMARLPIGQHHRSGPRLANFLRKRITVFNGCSQAGISKIQALPALGADHRPGRLRFLRAYLTCTARSHFALSEIENTHGVPFLDHFDQGTGASEFDVIRMCGNSQNIYVFHNRFTFCSSSCSSTWYLKALLPLINMTGICTPYAFSSSGSVSISIIRKENGNRRRTRSTTSFASSQRWQPGRE